MTFRPRIRTIKPEMWADEKVGALSRDARLLFVGLITMADDAGRLRALPAGIIGHVYPYDADVTAAKLAKWMRELERVGLVLAYESGSRPYVWLSGWSRHQKVNRANPSELPPPPVRDVSVSGHGPVSDPSVNDHGNVRDDARSHAQAGAIADQDQDLNPPTPLTQKPEFVEWLADHEHVTGHASPKPGTKALAALAESFQARRAEGYSVDDLKLASNGAHADEYRREHGYDTADSVLRPTKVASLIAKGKLRTRPGAALAPADQNAALSRAFRPNGGAA